MTHMVDGYPTKEQMLSMVDELKKEIEANNGNAHSFALHFTTHPSGEPHHPDRQVRFLGAVCPGDLILMFNAFAQTQERLAQSFQVEQVLITESLVSTRKDN